MAGKNGHSKRPIKRTMPKKKMSKTERSFITEAFKVIFKRQGRNN